MRSSRSEALRDELPDGDSPSVPPLFSGLASSRRRGRGQPTCPARPAPRWSRCARPGTSDAEHVHTPWFLGPTNAGPPIATLRTRLGRMRQERSHVHDMASPTTRSSSCVRPSPNFRIVRSGPRAPRRQDGMHPVSRPSRRPSRVRAGEVDSPTDALGDLSDRRDQVLRVTKWRPCARAGRSARRGPVRAVHHDLGDGRVFRETACTGPEACSWSTSRAGSPARRPRVSLRVVTHPRTTPARLATRLSAQDLTRATFAGSGAHERQEGGSAPRVPIAPSSGVGLAAPAPSAA
jgi:hypothetical protein